MKGLIVNAAALPPSSTSSSDVDPVITLTVRAYDLGIPSLETEVPVHIFTEEVSSRSAKQNFACYLCVKIQSCQIMFQKKKQGVFSCNTRTTVQKKSFFSFFLLKTGFLLLLIFFMLSRTMRFIIDRSPRTVERDEEQVR